LEYKLPTSNPKLPIGDQKSTKKHIEIGSKLDHLHTETKTVLLVPLKIFNTIKNIFFTGGETAALNGPSLSWLF